MKQLILLILITSLPRIVSGQANQPNEMESYQREVLRNTHLERDSTHIEFTGLTLGYQGGNHHFFELGLGSGFIASKFLFAGMGPSVELNLQDKVNGYKFGVWANFLISTGLNLVVYHNYRKESAYYNKVSAGLRPEIGFGYSAFNFTYGYNILINNAKMSGVNKHMFSIRCMIPVIKK